MRGLYGAVLTDSSGFQLLPRLDRAWLLDEIPADARPPIPQTLSSPKTASRSVEPTLTLQTRFNIDHQRNSKMPFNPDKRKEWTRSEREAAGRSAKPRSIEEFQACVGCHLTHSITKSTTAQRLI